MRFSVEPPPPPLGPGASPTKQAAPGDASGFQQWHDAMRMVARLPGGVPPEFRRKVSRPPSRSPRSIPGRLTTAVTRRPTLATCTTPGASPDRTETFPPVPTRFGRLAGIERSAVETRGSMQRFTDGQIGPDGICAFLKENTVEPHASGGDMRPCNGRPVRACN